LSPIGGQASLRVLSTTNVTDAKIDIPWVVPNVTNLWPTEDLSSLGTRLSYITAMSEISAFVPHDKGGYSDSNGNLLVPLINPDVGLAPFAQQNFSGYTNNDSTELYEADYVPPFSSMLGIPVYGPYTELSPYADQLGLDGVDISANLTFSISLFQFSCSSNTDYLINDSWTDLLSPQANKTELRYRGQSGSGFFLDMNSNVNAGEPQVVLFGSFHQPFVTIWNCSINLNTREVSAACVSAGPQEKPSCWLLSMAPAQISSMTPFSDSSYASEYLDTWPIIDYAPSNGSSAAEHWLLNGYIDLDNGLVDLSTVNNAEFSSRLTTAFNTLWVSQLWTGGNVTMRVGQRPCLLNVTSATPMVFLPFTIVTCNWYWFTILIAASLILIVSALFSTWLCYRINTPDILGYVSSMTIENPYINIPGVKPGSASHLDGLERTRLCFAPTLCRISC
jgi:hypothetical protein